MHEFSLAWHHFEKLRYAGGSVDAAAISQGRLYGTVKLRYIQWMDPYCKGICAANWLKRKICMLSTSEYGGSGQIF